MLTYTIVCHFDDALIVNTVSVLWRHNSWNVCGLYRKVTPLCGAWL